jgi:O-antigen/teichoic acid export membrane protein
VVVWPQLLGWCATLGLARATAHYRARAPEAAGALVANGVLVSLVLGACVAIAAQVTLGKLLWQYPSDVVVAGRALLLLTPVFALTDILQGLMQGAGRFGALVAFRVLQPLIQLAGFLMLLGTGWMSLWSATLIFGTSLFAVLLGQLLTLRTELGFGARPDRGLFRDTRGYAIRSYPAFLADVAISSLDQVVLVPLLKASELGHYAVATRAMLLAQAPGAVSQVLFSTISGLTFRLGVTLAMRAFVGSIAVTMVFGAALWIAADDLIDLLFGAAFRPAVGPFRVLLGGALGAGASKLAGETLNGLGKPQYVSVSQVVTIAVMVVLLWALVPTHGVHGAAWAVTMAHWADFGVAGLLLRRAWRDHAEGGGRD